MLARIGCLLGIVALAAVSPPAPAQCTPEPPLTLTGTLPMDVTHCGDIIIGDGTDNPVSLLIGTTTIVAIRGSITVASPIEAAGDDGVSGDPGPHASWPVFDPGILHATDGLPGSSLTLRTDPGGAPYVPQLRKSIYINKAIILHGGSGGYGTTYNPLEPGELPTPIAGGRGGNGANGGELYVDSSQDIIISGYTAQIDTRGGSGGAAGDGYSSLGEADAHGGNGGNGGTAGSAGSVTLLAHRYGKLEDSRWQTNPYELVWAWGGSGGNGGDGSWTQINTSCGGPDYMGVWAGYGGSGGRPGAVVLRGGKVQRTTSTGNMIIFAQAGSGGNGGMGGGITAPCHMIGMDGGAAGNAGFPADQQLTSITVFDVGTLSKLYLDVSGGNGGTGGTGGFAYICNLVPYLAEGGDGATGGLASGAQRFDVQFKPSDRFGDFDHDCDVDIGDFTTFQNCYNGVNRPPQPACIGADGFVLADKDGDADVDLTDFSAFQAVFNGPNSPAVLYVDSTNTFGGRGGDGGNGGAGGWAYVQSGHAEGGAGGNATSGNLGSHVVTSVLGLCGTLTACPDGPQMDVHGGDGGAGGKGGNAFAPGGATWTLGAGGNGGLGGTDGINEFEPDCINPFGAAASPGQDGADGDPVSAYCPS